MASGRNNEIKALLTLETNNFRKALNTATGQVQRFGRDLKSSLTTFGGRSFDGLSAGFHAVGAAATAAAAAGLYAFSKAMSGAIDSAKQVERLSFAFTAISGKSSLSAKELEFIRTESDKLGISFIAAADAYKGIFASSKGTLLEGENTRKIFSAVAAASSALGLSADDTSAALLAISQMISKGKISAEELRGQLGERLPGAFKLMADAAGVSTEALDAMLQKGEVGIDLLPKFAQLLQDQYGKAAASADGFIKAQQNVKNEYFFLQAAAGELITKNTFVIESFKILSQTFKDWTGSIVLNREQLVGLVKVGFLGLVDAIGGAIEVVRGFYNAWQGVGLIAHGVTWLIIKGMELSVTAIRGALLPLDLLLQGMVKVGAIDSNPLQNWEQTLKGVSQVSADEFNKLLDKVLQTNQSFDQAKTVVEDYRKKIAEIPATFKDSAAQVKGETEKISQEIRRLADGSYTNAPEKNAAASKASAESIKQDAKEVGEAWRQAEDGTYTNIPEKAAANSKASAASIKQDAKEIGEAWRIMDDGTFTNMTDNQRQAFETMADGIKQDLQSVGTVNARVIDQVKQNIAFLEAELAKGGLSDTAVAKVEALKEKLAKVLAESSENQKADIEGVADTTKVIGNGFKISFDEAINSSYAATVEILADIDKIKRAASSIKYATPSSEKVPGYATGGFHPGGLRIVGEQGPELEYTGPSRIFNNASTNIILKALQSLPRFATGGPIGLSPAASMAAGDTYNLSVNYNSGQSAPPSVRTMARELFIEWKNMHRGLS